MSETFHGDDPETAIEHNPETQKIRFLNDQLRTSFSGGRILMTPGVQALPEAVLPKALEAIRTFDAFDEGNDPWGTHEFGAVEIDGHKVWFKVDCYDLNYQYGSPDPSDPRVTARVMTILLPGEY